MGTRRFQAIEPRHYVGREEEMARRCFRAAAAAGFTDGELAKAIAILSNPEWALFQARWLQGCTWEQCSLILAIPDRAAYEAAAQAMEEKLGAAWRQS